MYFQELMWKNIQFNLIYHWQKIKPLAYGRFNLLFFYSRKLQKKKKNPFSLSVKNKGSYLLKEINNFIHFEVVNTLFHPSLAFNYLL